LYAAVSGQGIFVSHDHAQSWTAIGSPVPASPYFGGAAPVNSIVTAGSSGTLYAIVQNIQSSGFVTRLTPDGSGIVFSTLLRGRASMVPVVTYAAEPGVFTAQNWIGSIALDRAGNIVVAGGSRGNDLPLLSPAQSANTGRADAFATVISADGSRLLYSTYIGGSSDDGALAVTADAQGNVIIAGQTWSSDFPVPGGVQPPAGQLGDLFVTKLSTAVSPDNTQAFRRTHYRRSFHR
jgi:hypothetical protein